MASDLNSGNWCCGLGNRLREQREAPEVVRVKGSCRARAARLSLLPALYVARDTILFVSRGGGRRCDRHIFFFFLSQFSPFESPERVKKVPDTVYRFCPEK